MNIGCNPMSSIDESERTRFSHRRKQMGIVLFCILSIAMLVVFTVFAFTRYYYFILAYTKPYAILVFIALFVLLAGALYITWIIYQGKKLRRAVQPIIGAFMLILLVAPIIGISTMETQYIKGESDLNKLTSLYSTQEEWETRASTIRKGILKGAELDPLPPKTALNATIHSTRFYASYSVANVYFESIPGFFVTGNLYRPLNYQSGSPKPLLLIPHGHFSAGRFEAHNQQMGAMFARMGAIAMTYDMVGRGENTQMEHETPYALTLQILNSIRVLDFLLTLENVDNSKIGITGASGGGTQTILLTAVDARVTVSAPVVMVSSWIYGGCQCESGLPIHKGDDYSTNNAEIAALAAPRPMLLVSCGNDWTQFTPELEYPFIQRIYGFYDAETRVKNVHLPNDEHDFGPAKRFAVYEFMAEKLGLSIQNVMDFEQLFDEATNTIESIDPMRAFDASHPRPLYALTGVDNIMAALRNLQGIEADQEKTIDSIPEFFFFAVSVLCLYCEMRSQSKRVRKKQFNKHIF